MFAWNLQRFLFCCATSSDLVSVEEEPFLLFFSSYFLWLVFVCSFFFHFFSFFFSFSKGRNMHQWLKCFILLSTLFQSYHSNSSHIHVFAGFRQYKVGALLCLIMHCSNCMRPTWSLLSTGRKTPFIHSLVHCGVLPKVTLMTIPEDPERLELTIP